MDKLKNNPSWIVLNSPTQNDPKKSNEIMLSTKNKTQKMIQKA